MIAIDVAVTAVFLVLIFLLFVPIYAKKMNSNNLCQIFFQTCVFAYLTRAKRNVMKKSQL